jgi:hypothetical protein
MRHERDKKNPNYKCPTCGKSGVNQDESDESIIDIADLAPITKKDKNSSKKGGLQDRL